MLLFTTGALINTKKYKKKRIQGRRSSEDGASFPVGGLLLGLSETLGLNVANVYVEDVHLSNHNCVFFDLNFPSEQISLKLRTGIVMENSTDEFSVMFDRFSMSGGTDVGTHIQSFNADCLSILDHVAPVKPSSVSQKKSYPWINEFIRNLRIMWCKPERLQKLTKL